jgi:hypothetical protein
LRSVIKVASTVLPQFAVATSAQQSAATSRAEAIYILNLPIKEIGSKHLKNIQDHKEA